MAAIDDLKVPFVSANVRKRLSAVIINRSTLKRSREDIDQIKLFIDTTELRLAKGVSSLLYVRVCQLDRGGEVCVDVINRRWVFNGLVLGTHSEAWKSSNKHH